MTSTEHEPLPVKGYVPQSDENVALANEGKELEERYLRWLDKLMARSGSDKRMIALAITNHQTAAMWAIRSIFQPRRVALPEDPPAAG